MQKVQGADKINKFKSLEGERHKHGAQRTQALNATNKRYHKTLPLMGAFYVIDQIFGKFFC